jgi:hypothetical protein
MFPAATLFLDVCVQRDLWPGGTWPLMTAEAGRNVGRVLALAAAMPVRSGSVCCRHDGGAEAAAAGSPAHCLGPDAGARPVDYPPLAVHCQIVESGCGVAPDEREHALAFRRMTSGIRDAVVFGAGLEYALAHAMAALLRSRIRTHLVMDAAGAADDVAAQLVVADLKRRGVDVVTVDVVARLFSRG